MTRMVKPQEYMQLIAGFLEHRITAVEFEKSYNKLFYDDQGGQPEEIFRIIDRLFAEIDAYWPECKPEDEVGETPDPISEQTLRKYAAVALEKLNAALM